MKKLNKKSTRIVMCLFALLAIAPSKTNAQVFWDSAFATNVQTCLKPETVIVKYTVLSAQSSGSTLKAALPQGFRVNNIVSVKRNSSSASYTASYSASNRIVTFTLSSALSVGDVVRIELNQFANCSAGTSSYTTRDTFTFTGSTGSSTQNGNLFNGSSPALSITSISNTPGTASVGTLVTRKYTITNGGNGASSHFFVSDNFGGGNLSINTSSFKINPSGVNYSIPGSKITLTTDSVLVNFDPAQIQQIGDGDTLFENGESFVLQYEVTPLLCGSGNVLLSNYKTSWLCPSNSRCNYYSVSDGLGITIPGAPNIVYFQTKMRPTTCWDNTLLIDTGSIKNTGSGPATNIVVRVGINGYPNIFRGDMLGYIDTTKFFVKKGLRGAWTKVSYSIYMVGTAGTGWGTIGATCDPVNKPMVVEFTWPRLEPNDTLYFTNAIKHCSWDYTCEASQSYLHQTAIPGSLVEIAGYKNACGNVAFAGFSNPFVGYAYPNLQAQNLAPQSANPSTVADFEQNLQSIPLYWNYYQRGTADVTITLPTVLHFDTSAGALVYISNGGTNYYPSAHPSANVWRFKVANLPTNGSLHIKLKGYCDPNVCSGIVYWGYKWDVNPDTTACSNQNTWGCLQYPISWTSNCKVCCDSGLVNLEYRTDRINYGKPDNNNDYLPDPTGTIDLTKIRTNMLLYGDTVEYYQKSYIKTGVLPSWPTLVAEFDVRGNTSWWDLLSSNITIKRAAGGTTTGNGTADWSGDLVRFNYSSLGPFFNNDTIILRMRVKLKVNVETSVNTQNQAYVSRINNVNQSSATRFSCGPILDGLFLWPQVQFLDRVQALSSDGCTQLQEYNNYFVAEGGYGYGYINRFVYEYRPNGYPTKVKHKYPSGWQIDSVEIVGYWGGNLPAAYTNVNVPFTFINDTLKYDLSSFFIPNGGLLLPVDEGGTINLRHYITPTCKVSPNLTQVVSAQNDFNVYQIKSVSYLYNSNSYNTQTTIRNIQPQFLVNSSTPVATAYTKNISWPLNYTNVTSTNSVNNWLYMTNASGLTVIDSIKEGTTKISKDVNGFYRLGAINGSITRSLIVYAHTSSCNADSIVVRYGYKCSGYPTSISEDCAFPPLKLYVQPAPAAIQTTITALASTPNNPANPSAGNYGSSNVNMCSSFPLEFTILSTQPGTIYGVKENLNLPISGLNVGLDYVSDSGYIEYPAGSTPRKFSVAANNALLSQVSSGLLTFDLAQIAPDSFNSNNGLDGTGAAPSNAYRTAILRFKLRTNCNLISGAQWQAVQQALNPCGGTAGGNNGITSGFPLNVNGVTPVPYVANVNVVPTLNGCSGDTATFKIVKIGSSAVNAGDSIRLFIPTQLTNSAIRCVGSKCPSAFPAFQTNPVIGGKELVIRIPSSMGNLDSIVFKTKITGSSPNGCSASVKVGADITRQLTIFCPTTGTTCPNAKQSLGNTVQFIAMNRPQLSLSSFTGKHLLWTTYATSGTVNNAATGEGVTAGTTTQIKYFWDINHNNQYDIGTDLIAGTKNITAAIASGGSINWTDTFTDASGQYPPSATLPLIAMINSSIAPNCNCNSLVLSTPVVSLPVKYLSYTITPLGCTNKIEWTTTSEENLQYFVVQTLVNNEWKSIGRIAAKGQNAIGTARYSFAHNAEQGVHFYRLVEVDNKGQQTPNNVLKANNSCNPGDKKITLLPNPAENYVSILTNNNNAVCEKYTLSIVNMEGKELMTLTDAQPNTAIDLKGITAGLYVVKVQCDAFTETHKLIIR